MLRHRSFFVRPLGALLALVGLLALAAAAQAGPTRQEPPLDKKFYLPMVHKVEDYRGRVTYNGAPAAGRTVTLRYWDNISGDYTNWSTATTDANGNYVFFFTDLPPVGGGKDFYVRWTNDSGNTAYLAAWYCDDVKYLPTDNYVCNMDIADINLLSPSGAVSVSLPYTFTWTRRPVASDNYQVDFFFYNGITLDPRYSTGPLGYVGYWTMTTLPTNMIVGTQYWWSVRANGPNGYGDAFYIRSIRFNNTGGPALAEETGLPGELPRGPDAAREARP